MLKGVRSAHWRECWSAFEFEAEQGLHPHRGQSPRNIGNAARDPVGGGLQWIVRQVRVSRGCLHLVMTK